MRQLLRASAIQQHARLSLSGEAPREGGVGHADCSFIPDIAGLPLDADGKLRELAAAGHQLVLDSGAVDESCGRLCAHHVGRWWEWFTAQRRFGGAWQRSVPGSASWLAVAKAAPALLIVPPRIDDYLKLIGDKSRNMLRKAERAGYTFRPFVTADHLDDIYAVNTSKEIRQGRPMSEGYLQYPTPLDPAPNDYCPRHRVDNFACFLGNTVVAYCNLVTVGELAVVNTIIGHGDHLKNGVMNLLVKGMVEWAIGRYPSVRALNYLKLDGRSGLDRFKRSVGFQSCVLGLLAADSLVPHVSTWTGSAPDIADQAGSGVRASLRPRVLAGHWGSVFRAAVKALGAAKVAGARRRE